MDKPRRARNGHSNGNGNGNGDQSGSAAQPRLPKSPHVVSSQTRAIVQQLVEKGKAQGWLSQEQILQVFPEAESNIEQLEEVYIVLFEEGIQLVDENQATDRSRRQTRRTARKWT